MDIVISRERFLSILGVGSSMLGERVLPIYEYIRLRIKGRIVSISSYSSNGVITSKGECIIGDGINEEVEFGVLGKDLLGFIRSVSSDELVLSIDLGNMEMGVSYGVSSRGRFSFRIIGVLDFPSLASSLLSKEGEISSFRISSGVLLDWIQRGRSYVSDDDLRPQLTGMYLGLDGSKVGVCFSDATSLYTNSIDIGVVGGIGKSEIVLPSSSFSSLLSLLSSGGIDSEVLVKQCVGNVIFEIPGKVRLCSRVISERYPNFGSILPKDYDCRVLVSKRELIESLKRQLLVVKGSPSGSMIKLSVVGDTMMIEATNYDLGKRCSDEIKVSSIGEDVELHLSGIRLMTAIGSVEGDEIVFEFKSGVGSPCVIKESVPSNMLLLIMPMRAK